MLALRLKLYSTHQVLQSKVKTPFRYHVLSLSLLETKICGQVIVEVIYLNFCFVAVSVSMA